MPVEEEKSQFRENIFAFFFLNRNVSQKFPDFPDEDDGGSNAIFAKKSLDEIQEDLNAVRLRLP